MPHVSRQASNAKTPDSSFNFVQRFEGFSETYSQSLFGLFFRCHESLSKHWPGPSWPSFSSVGLDVGAAVGACA